VTFEQRLLEFGRYLRSLGLDIHVGRMLDAVEALLHVDIGRRDDVYHTLRALFVHRREDLALFDQAFDTFWGKRRRATNLPADSPSAAGSVQGRDGGAESPALHHTLSLDESAATDESGEPALTWSSEESLRTKDFATFTADDIARGRAALDRLVWRPGFRRTRRWVRGRGPRLDLRRALARSLRSGGDVVTIPRLRRRTVPRPLVLLCDVSGSMDRYSRMLLHFAHGLVRRHRRVEAFLFSTRLTRITRELRGHRLDDVAGAVARAVQDWSGGTRIGESLRAFNYRWARRTLGHGAVVLIISDGWDRGDTQLLTQEMARLQRNCHRLIWLNPLLGQQDYRPVTAGMRAALPYIDDFLPAHTLDSLVALGKLLESVDDAARPARASRISPTPPSAPALRR
jgi:hypothetical protein